MQTTPLKKIKIGVFLGGQSREREISFAGGRTVYDSLDKAIFEAIPIFIDSLGNFILLDWQYLYRGSIRDFYPPNNIANAYSIPLYIESFANLGIDEQSAIINKVGKQLVPSTFYKYFDFAFLALHGPYGEDGALQGLLEWYQIPYSGSGLVGASVGMDKIFQKQLMQQVGLHVPNGYILHYPQFEQEKNKEKLLEEIIATVGLPFVVKSPHQGSSIGVSIVKTKNVDTFIHAVNRSFFIETVTSTQWKQFKPDRKTTFLNNLIDLREGIGLPVIVQGVIINDPDTLITHLDNHFQKDETSLQLISTEAETSVIFEEFIHGREFSCIVVEEPPYEPVSLPPTEMLTGDMPFDYRAKYLPGIVRKQTPMSLPYEQINAIRKACSHFFQIAGCHVYARIDGFITPNYTIYLNDPNTTAGMNPSSFLFHQAATIGLNPTQLLTFLIRASLATRINASKVNPTKRNLLQHLDLLIDQTSG